MAVKGPVGLKHRTLPVFLLICICSCWAKGQVQDRVLAATNPNQRAILDGTVHPLARTQYDVGRVDGNSPLTGIAIYFALSGAQEAQLKVLLEEQQNPSSPLYHKWLTPSDYGSRFGLTDGDIGKVKDWLQAQGFSIDAVSQTRTSIRFSGTIMQVENAFRTEMHHYNIDNELHIANATALSVPLALSGVILSVRNVTDFRPQPKHSSRRVSPGTSAHFTSSISGNHYLAPDDFTTIYDVKALYNSGYDGSGEKIVVVGQTKISTSDIDAFRKAAGLPAKSPTTVLVPGSGSSANNSTGDEEESDLDLEWSGAIAKNATIYFVYTGNNQNYSVIDSLQYAIDHNTAPIISMSYGGCEASWSQTDVSTVESWLQQANSQGQTVVVASGDSGAADCDYSGGSGPPVTSATHGLAVDFPASSPYVTGIGGTEFNEGSGDYWNSTNNSGNGSAISHIPEGVWNDTSTSIANRGGFAAGGGGKSSLFAKPSWQTGTGVPSDGARDVPDISLAASNYHDGYLFCTQGSCTNGFRDSQDYLAVAGGTSFGAPTFSGILALINQKLGSSGQANINSALYQAAISDYSNAFHDIATGDNKEPCANGSRDCGSSGYIGYTAATGYDLASGLGSIDAYNLAGVLSNSTSKTNSTTTLSYSPSTVLVGQTVTLTAKVVASSGSSTPTGTVTFVADGSNIGSPVTLSGGSSPSTTTSFSASGSHTVSATYSGDSNFNRSSASSTISVSASSAGATTTTTVTANPASVALGGSVALTANVTSSASGTITGAVTFTLGSTTLGTGTVSSGVAAFTATASSANGFSVGSNTITATYGGDSNYAGSSGTTTVTATQPRITVSATDVTIAALGDTGISTVTVTSSGGYSGTVKFTASTTSSLSGTYYFNPATVTLTSGSSGTTTLTISTVHSSIRGVPGLDIKSAASVGLATLVLLWVFPITRRRWAQIFLCLLCLGITMSAISCGSGGNPGTGTYAINVIATDTSSSSITASTTFTLAVK